MFRMTPVARAGVLVIALICFAIWFLGGTDKKHVQSGTGDIAEPRVPSVQRSAAPESTTEGLKEARADFAYSEQQFTDQYAKMAADSQLVNLAIIHADLESFLTDARSLHQRARSAYGLCITSNDDLTVFNNCAGPSLYLRSGYAHFGIEDSLRELPDISRAKMLRDDQGWQDSVSARFPKADQALESIENHPDLAQQCGVDSNRARQTLQQAHRLYEKSLLEKDEDPTLGWILVAHADLLVDDFQFQISRYSVLLLSGKPLFP
jgi:hypothetical protein